LVRKNQINDVEDFFTRKFVFKSDKQKKDFLAILAEYPEGRRTTFGDLSSCITDPLTNSPRKNKKKTAATVSTEADSSRADDWRKNKNIISRIVKAFSDEGKQITRQEAAKHYKAAKAAGVNDHNSADVVKFALEKEKKNGNS
jgi:hypothetical protein